VICVVLVLALALVLALVLFLLLALAVLQLDAVRRVDEGLLDMIASTYHVFGNRTSGKLRIKAAGLDLNHHASCLPFQDWRSKTLKNWII